MHFDCQKMGKLQKRQIQRGELGEGSVAVMHQLRTRKDTPPFHTRDMLVGTSARLYRPLTRLGLRSRAIFARPIHCGGEGSGLPSKRSLRPSMTGDAL